MSQSQGTPEVFRATSAEIKGSANTHLNSGVDDGERFGLVEEAGHFVETEPATVARQRQGGSGGPCLSPSSLQTQTPSTHNCT